MVTMITCMTIPGIAGDASVYIDQPNRRGFPPLAYAIASGRADVVLVLLESLAMPNVKTADGVPMLALAVLAEEPEIVRLLLSFGADPSSIPRHLWDLQHEGDTDDLIGGSGPEGADAPEGGGKAGDSSDPGALIWCSSDFAQNIEVRLTWAMRYWLREASQLPPLTTTTRRSLQVGCRKGAHLKQLLRA